MSSLKFAWIFALLLAGPALAHGTPAFAQGTRSGTTQPQRPMNGGRNAVVAQPSTNNIFKDPIGQGATPATQANGNQNSIRTSPSR